MLVPGVPGLSENIDVVSIVDRYLEHSRIIFFRNGGNREVYLSSADWMPRNLDRRVELLFPVVQEDLRERLEKALQTFFADTASSEQLLPDGSYRKNSPGEGVQPLRAQEEFYRTAVKRRDGIQAPRKASAAGGHGPA